MEVPWWVLIVLVGLVVALSLLTLLLICKLRRRYERSTPEEASAMTLPFRDVPAPPLSDYDESDRQSFMSCMDELTRADVKIGLRTSYNPLPVRRGIRRPRQNSNEVWHYEWLRELLQSITDGRAAQSALQVDTRLRGTPLFVVAGACPNAICGMQALMYCQMPSCIDFWWIKPEKSGKSLEKETLNKHSHGTFKNSTDRGQKHFAPLAEKFSSGTSEGAFSYGVDCNGRAFIDVEASGLTTRMLIYLIWQESWSMAAWGKKFIEGKLCYQKSSPTSQPACKSSAPDDAHTAMQALPLFARQYRIVEGGLYIDAHEEEVSALLPLDPFQEMHDMAVLG